MTARAPASAPLLAALALAACAGTPATPVGRWAGPVTALTQGPTCLSGRGTVQIRDNVVLFTPTEGTLVLQGEARPDGTLTAEKTQIGADKKPFQSILEARWTPETVTGTFTTPRCRFDVQLKRI